MMMSLPGARLREMKIENKDALVIHLKLNELVAVHPPRRGRALPAVLHLGIGTRRGIVRSIRAECTTSRR